MNTLNGFDKIARFYDQLARIIFGNSVQRSQLYFINQIPKHASILILGGGTGWILKEILKVNSDCEIVYIEASQNMLAFSKKTAENFNNIQFIHGTEENIPASNQFDVIVTNFYLDLFPSDKLILIVQKILQNVTRDSKWIATDFVNNGKWWQKLLLTLMYKFFNVTSKVKAKHLPDWSSILHQAGLNSVDSKHFYSGFIKTEILTRKFV